MLNMEHSRTAKDILFEAQAADCVAVNKHIMREFGANAALLYALMLEEYENVKKGGDAGTKKALLERIQQATRFPLWEIECAVDDLERAGVIDSKEDAFRIFVIDKIPTE
ncbi:MAG: hypothetical protein KIB08_06260 [Negativicoccus succinicivorans]|uniref:hypothetical protein n=1 Tax=Negativicoccus succinicivorans TaxID=620903 RepID=UPI0026EE2436|nr:hypothetical protein [Negativicoccus succinicivorans]MBS5888091.1 hypothetical protein [Negativicoccus succinicivorans]